MVYDKLLQICQIKVNNLTTITNNYPSEPKSCVNSSSFFKSVSLTVGLLFASDASMSF